MYRIHRSPMCEYMVNFIHKLKRLPEKYMMNSVLENFTILQVTSHVLSRPLIPLFSYHPLEYIYMRWFMLQALIFSTHPHIAMNLSHHNPLSLSTCIHDPPFLFLYLYSIMKLVEPDNPYPSPVHIFALLPSAHTFYSSSLLVFLSLD